MIKKDNMPIIDFSKLKNEELIKYAESKGFDPATSATREELLDLLTHNSNDTTNIKETPEEIRQSKKYVVLSILIVLFMSLILLVPILLSLNIL